MTQAASSSLKFIIVYSHSRLTSKTCYFRTNYEGLAYLGGYALAWAACLNNETIYNLLLEKGACPDSQVGTVQNLDFDV